MKMSQKALLLTVILVFAVGFASAAPKGCQTTQVWTVDGGSSYTTTITPVNWVSASLTQFYSDDFIGIYQDNVELFKETGSCDPDNHYGSISIPLNFQNGVAFLLKTQAFCPCDCTHPNARVQYTYTSCSDLDGDNYNGQAVGGNDCNDENINIYPGATEICNGADDNCNGLIDDNCVNAGPICGDNVCNGIETPSTCSADCGLFIQNYCYKDTDSDGYSDGNYTIVSSNTCPANYHNRTYFESVNKTAYDCNDNNASIHPLAVEYINGVDDNCDGFADENGAINNTNNTNGSNGSTNGSVATVSGLRAISVSTHSITWEWINPVQNYRETIVYLDGALVQTSTSGRYTASGLDSDTSYTITVNTRSTSGIVNNANVFNIQRTNEKSSTSKKCTNCDSDNSVVLASGDDYSGSGDGNGEGSTTIISAGQSSKVKSSGAWVVWLLAVLILVLLLVLYIVARK